MPGISDKSALRVAVVDSLVLSEATEHRLAARNVRDIKSAMRLREFERDHYKDKSPATYKRIENLSKEILTSGLTGNHYVYLFMALVVKLTKDIDICKQLRDSSVLRSFTIVNKMMISKYPAHAHQVATAHLPAGYSKVQGRYVTMRSLYNKFMKIHSTSGNCRGKLQHINTTSGTDLNFQENMGKWVEEFYEKFVTEDHLVIQESDINLAEEWRIKMVRISDIIYIEVYDKWSNINFMFTSNHFERAVSFIIQYSNMLMGTILAYGMDDRELGEVIITFMDQYIRQLAKIGVKDDLAVGEAGKAVTDLLKAKLSQTEELPWNNFRMLMKTYSESRAANASELLEILSDYHFDPDLALNLSYMWKLAVQPDSDIMQDFKELTDGLSKPNPVSEESEVLMTTAIRRAILVGALRENRQVRAEKIDGSKMDPELEKVIKASSVSDSDLRNVTYGMLKSVRIKVPDIFPDIYDITHLSFKDKSSSITSDNLRRDIAVREDLFRDIKTLEDMAIMEASILRSEEFLNNLKVPLEDKDINKALRVTANDILSSIDENLATVFMAADRKYKSIVTSLRGIGSKYGDKSYIDDLREWMKDRDHLYINTATEPKMGEVHKRSVRIFYMFEKGMKTFLSQFERMARLLDYYIKGAEIVKGDRAREKHMNILSSAHHATMEGILSYQILFDLSKFSQKFNHKIIDAAALVIGELTNYPEYAHISDIFKASFLYVSARNIHTSFTGVLGGFEGFLNFLWTGIHATVMDIALKNCGRAGDLAAYSDDGLLMFTMRSKIDSPTPVIKEELISVISSITQTYTDFGLDFNLGKTLISRTLAEFLGVVQYKGRRLPTWMKELSHLGISDESKIVTSIAQSVVDTSSQYTALLKSGMPPFAATVVGYLEIAMTSGRRLYSLAKEAAYEIKEDYTHDDLELAVALFYNLTSSYGGVRVPDPLTSVTTADYDPTSEMMHDIQSLSKYSKKVLGITDLIYEAVEATVDYAGVLSGAVPINTNCYKYGTSHMRDNMAKKLKSKLPQVTHHPLSRSQAMGLHNVLETLENLNLNIVTSMVKYLVPLIRYNKMIAPVRSSAIARLLTKAQVRSLQRMDTEAVRKSMKQILTYLTDSHLSRAIDVNLLYKRSYPRLDLSIAIPSYRAISQVDMKSSNSCYKILVHPQDRLDKKGTLRLMNRSYRDDLVPPLITTDVNLKHLASAPDVLSHCMRALYSEVVSASAHGHDILPIADEICKLNNIEMVPTHVLSSLHDVQKIAIANRKKSIHRVYWSSATKSSITMVRLGELNFVMTQLSNTHYSLIVTVALAQAHLYMTVKDIRSKYGVFYISIDPIAVKSTKMHVMKLKESCILDQERRLQEEQMKKVSKVPASATFSIQNEIIRAIDSARLELQDNLVIGRMGMLSDMKALSERSSVSDPLRYALVWSLVSRLEAMVQGYIGSAGVLSSRVERYSPESIPIDIANMAIIYRSYREIRKSEIARVVKRNLNEALLSEAVADETLYAASELGVVHSLDKRSLMSLSAIITYKSIIDAVDCDLMYYSLDSSSEDIKAGIVSPARARAVGRVIDSLITEMFNSDYLDPSEDIRRLYMMIIRGSVRGSVHRSDPFNRRIAWSWVNFFSNMIMAFVHNMPDDYYNYSNLPNYPPKIPVLPGEVHMLEALLHAGAPGYSKPNRGGLDQYTQAVKYIYNLHKWGCFPHIHRYLMTASPRDIFEDLIETRVKPSMAFVRTISYSTLENFMRVSQIHGIDKYQISDELGSKISTMLSAQPKELTVSDLYNSEPNLNYRGARYTEFDFRIKSYTPLIHTSNLPIVYAYSLAMPLLLASGRTGFSGIVDLTNLRSHYTILELETILSEVSLPKGQGHSSIKLIVLNHMPEKMIVDTFNQLAGTLLEESMIVVEIPPDAGMVSLGLIQVMTRQKHSYVTVGVSSDLRGVSIYVISIMKVDLAVPTIGLTINRVEPVDLGMAALSPFVLAMNNGNYDLLGPLYITPMTQVGFPVYATALIPGEEIMVSVEEELLDKSRVSFVESVKPSETAIVFAKIDPSRMSHILRSLRIKYAQNYPLTNAIASAAHYYHAVNMDVSVKEYMEAFITLIEQASTTLKQIHVIRHILDPVISFIPMPYGELPARVQILEAEMITPTVPDMDYDEDLDDLIAPILRLTGHSLVKEEDRGLIVKLIQYNKIWDIMDKIWEIVKPPEVSRRRRMGGKVSLATASSVLDPYGITKVSSLTMAPELAATRDTPTVIASTSAFLVAFGSSLGYEEDPLATTSMTSDVFEIMSIRLKEVGFPEVEIDLLKDLTADELSALNALKEPNFSDAVMDQLDSLREQRVIKEGVI